MRWNLAVWARLRPPVPRLCLCSELRGSESWLRPAPQCCGEADDIGKRKHLVPSELPVARPTRIRRERVQLLPKRQSPCCG